MLPKDPFILLSTVNTKLRDHHESLEDLCSTHGVAQEDILATLAKVNYFYDTDQNQFK